jgi:hypothetical protein
MPFHRFVGRAFVRRRAQVRSADAGPVGDADAHAVVRADRAADAAANRRADDAAAHAAPVRHADW